MLRILNCKSSFLIVIMVLRILNCSDHFWSWGSLHARSPFWAQASASALIRWPSLRSSPSFLVVWIRVIVIIINQLDMTNYASHSYWETLIVVGWKLSSWIVITALLSSVISLEITMMMISIDMIIIIKLTIIRLMHNAYIRWPSLHLSDQGGAKSSGFKIKVTLR